MVSLRRATITVILKKTERIHAVIDIASHLANAIGEWDMIEIHLSPTEDYEDEPKSNTTN